MTNTDPPLYWFQNHMAQFIQHPAAQIGRSVPNPPALDGMFAPPISPTETIRILREMLADAGKAIAERDLKIASLRFHLSAAIRERQAALDAMSHAGATSQTTHDTFPARALRGGDGVPR